MDFERSITDGLTVAMRQIQADLRKELTAQGHVLTGRLRDSIDFEIQETAGGIVARMEAEDYGLVMEFGVSSERIPYTIGGGRRGGTSRYIQGLIRFWNLRGVTGREGVRAAFATAVKHKREGLPTRASFRFSSTGKRTGFIQTVLDRQLDLISRTIEEKTGAVLELTFVPESVGEVKIFL